MVLRELEREGTEVMNAIGHDEGLREGTRRVVVVGGANTDIAGLSAARLIYGDSNPGHVRISAGGVARNIAENLARLGVNTRLVTAFGDDANARDLARECRDAGIGVEESLVVSGLSGPVYLSIMDDGGDMALALNDMRALDELTPAVLEARTRVLDEADLIVVDTNLPAETIAWLAEYAHSPLLLDAVSVAKAPRAAPVLSRMHTIKASGLEAGVLLGREIRNRDHAEEAARELVALGVSRAFVTAGAFGVAWADGAACGRLPAPKVEEIRNASGAGDAFAAGIAYATLATWPTAKAAAFGSACAAVTLESEDTVNVGVTLEAITNRMEAMLT